MGFSVIGWKVYESKDSRGAAYLKILKALQKLIDMTPELGLNFDDVDLFLHTISAEEEGKEAVRALTEGREILMPMVEGVREISREVESMEFAMEKYLEEFIEANFDKINFGAKLELYQDEENSGRQYPTPIGKIDLLAIDKQRKEFFVIELKKGKSSDAVVGQILRYMDWVQKNKVEKGVGVKGIIIVKEVDNNLEYALSALKGKVNISCFVYNVKFFLEAVP
jgi:restriction system protein